MGLLVGTVVAVVTFVLVERRASEPVIPLRFFRNRTFVVTTLLGLVVGAGMMGALAYLPTYLQMVYGVDATESGLLLLPMVAGLLVTSLASGAAVTKTGRYKVLPIAGTATAAVAMFLLSTLTVSTSLVLVGLYVGILGAGLGLFMQIIVLAVQNAVSPREIGTATSSNNLFRELGVTVGTAVLGTVFSSRLTDRLGGALGGSTESASSLTPSLVASLPGDVADRVVGAYADSLVPIFLWLVPMFLLGTVIAFFLPEVPLSNTSAGSRQGRTTTVRTARRRFPPRPSATGRRTPTAPSPPASAEVDGHRAAPRADVSAASARTRAARPSSNPGTPGARSPRTAATNAASSSS